VAVLIPNQSHTFNANDHLTTADDGNGVQALSYDKNGNTTVSQSNVKPTQQAGVTDVYSFDNRLIRRTRADGMEIDLIYTPDGNRTLKWVKQGGLTLRQHRYLVDSNNPTGYAQVVEEHNPLATAGETLRKVHLYGHDLIASEAHAGSAGAQNTHYYSYDGLGSVRAITNQQGLQDELYDYDAYGNLIGFAKYNATTDALEVQDLSDPAFSYASLTSEYLFTGEQWDADLGMYFLRARYLNTGTGRFHSMDTYEGRNGEPQTLHKDLYAHGNPVMFTDPSGMFSLQEMTAAIGMLIVRAQLVGARVYASTAAIASTAMAILRNGFYRFYSAIQIASGRILSFLSDGKVLRTSSTGGWRIRILRLRGAGSGRPSYEILNIKNIFRFEAHPIRSNWPSWAYYPHGHIDFLGPVVSKLHIPIVELTAGLIYVTQKILFGEDDDIEFENEPIQP
jgi:RHS repeat-associated protein